jgi:LysM domain
MEYTAANLADWWDATAEEYWQQQDDFIIQANQLGDAHPVIVLATWFNNFVATAPNRGALAVAGGLADVFRLGSDLTFDSVGGFVKGAVLEGLRLLTIAAPISGGFKKEIRHKALLALTKVEYPAGNPSSPCQYAAFNNILSFFKGNKDMMFVDVRDIAIFRGSDRGIFLKNLLEHPLIVRVLANRGITFKPLSQIQTIQQAIDAARRSAGVIRFTFKFSSKPGGKPDTAHVVLAIKDLKGNVRIVDYADPKIAGNAVGGMGHASWAEFVAARRGLPGYGPGLDNAVLQTGNVDGPAEFVSDFVRLVHLADKTFTFAVPVGIGMKWVRDGKELSFEEAAPFITQSAIDFFDSKYGAKAPPRPEDLYPAPIRPPEMEAVMDVHEIKGPGIQKHDWLSSIAGKYYKDALLWPVLWDFNKSPDFANPNKMYVGQRIKIPFIHQKSADDIKRYRERGYKWQGESWK